jgi:hypothetical protein
MPKVGEAFYELNAQDAGLFKSMAAAESRIRTSGANAEKDFGGSVAKSVTEAETAVAGGTQRMGGMLGGLGGGSDKLKGKFADLKTGMVQGLGIGGFLAVSSAASEFIGKITNSVGLASDLNETISKSDATFGSAAATIMEWSKTSSSSFGLTQKAALDYAATFGGLLMNFGQAPPKAAEMSKSLVQLAADMASFGNTSIEDALTAIQSGLVGEQEPLRRYQVNINEARIQTKALELGLWNGKGAMDANAKSSAIYALIMEDSARQQGDFARTAHGLANQERTDAAKNEEAWTRFGAALVPIAQVVMPAISAAGRALIDMLGGLLTHGRELGPVLVIGFSVLAAMLWTTLIPALAASAAGAIATAAPFIAVGLAIGGVVLVLDKLGLLGPLIDTFWNIISVGATIVGNTFGAVLRIIRETVSGIIGTIRNVMEIAAQIPGPWQEAASSMAASLQAMQNDVDKWGTDSAKSAKQGADDTITGVAGAIADGEPKVDAAATAAIKVPIVTAADKAKKDAVVKARETPGAIAAAIAAGRDAVASGADTLKQAFKDHISPTKEIAQLEGDLTGKLMRKGLKSNDPIIRGAAQQWKADIEARLTDLRQGVGPTALKTGQNYADSLENKKKQISAAAKNAVSGVDDHLKLPDAKTWGKHAGQQWADGLAAMAYYAAKAAKEYANGARGALEFTVPKEGPLRGMSTWGQHAGQSWAEGFASQADYLKTKVASYAAGGFATAPAFGAPPVIPDIDVARAIAPAVSNSNSNVSQISIGDIVVPVSFTGPAPSTAAGIRDLGRSLGEEIRLTLVRTPDIFPVRGG